MKEIGSRREKQVARYEIDMCGGPLLKGIFQFAWPMMLTSALQMCYNAADTAVLARFSGSSAMAAVGATATVISLLLNLFIGLATGVNILVARYQGAGERDAAAQVVHTSVLVALVGGVLLSALGWFAAPQMLRWMGTPGDIIDRSIRYIRIYFLGMPASLLYNYGTAALKAVGDTKRPLYFMAISGALNVLGNLVFVIVFSMDVTGVAVATVLSQTASAVLVCRCMARSDGVCRLQWKRLRFHRQHLLGVFRVGLPAGIQASMFGIANILIQTFFNSFGSSVLSGDAILGTLEQPVFIISTAFSAACATFASQNYGAGNLRRADRAVWLGTGAAAALTVAFGVVLFLFGPAAAGWFSAEPAVLEYAVRKLRMIAMLYAFLTVGNVVSSGIRGLGYSLLPTAISMVGICCLRITWLYTVFAWQPTVWVLCWSMPVSWAVTAVGQLACYLYLRRKLLKRR